MVHHHGRHFFVLEHNMAAVTSCENALSYMGLVRTISSKAGNERFVVARLRFVQNLKKGARKQGNSFTEASVSPFVAPGNICCGRKICFPGSKNVSEFVEKHFASSANASSNANRESTSGYNVYATMSPSLRAP